MSMPKTLRRKWDENPYCYYCKNKTILYRQKKNIRPPNLTATLEHLFPKHSFISSEIRNNPKNIVISCLKCNNDQDNSLLNKMSLNDKKNLYGKLEKFNFNNKCNLFKNDIIRLFIKPYLFCNYGYLKNLVFVFKKFIIFYKRNFYRKMGIELKKQ